MRKPKILKHQFSFIQNGGLIQAKITTIDDVLNLKDLDKKMWTALACPVQGLEFSEETLSVLDKDKNGRVRSQEILEAVEYIKKYFAKPEIIMQKGDTIPLEALGTTPFDCGHSPLDSAKALLSILGKADATEISISDLAVNDKIFASNVFNGDGVLTAECAECAEYTENADYENSENIYQAIKDIIEGTGGAEDISGAKGITRQQFDEFVSDAQSIIQWKKKSEEDNSKIFFLGDKTESAYKSYIEVKDKINDYFLRTNLSQYDNQAGIILKEKAENMILDESGNLQDLEHLAMLPISFGRSESTDEKNPKECILFIDEKINPAWKSKIENFKIDVLENLLKNDLSMTQSEWNKIKSSFELYEDWICSRPENTASALSFERLAEILDEKTKNKIETLFDKEESCPPIATSAVELKKMLLLRRDFVELLKNFVSFEQFYTLGEKAIFQCGSLFIDGRECELCVKVLDSAKHSTMASLSQCYLAYCDCTKRGTTDEETQKMQIAALISDGNVDNIIVGRNGIFYDRNGEEWDATIVKIIENPINIKQAFLSPYKKLLRMIQEKIAKSAADKEKNINSKLVAAVENPNEALKQNPALNQASANQLGTLGSGNHKIDIGTIAALSVTFTGLATVVGGILNAFFGLGWWIPVGIIGIILAISLPSMILAYLKLRQRNIAPILDASGWAINGNTKISTILGRTLTHTPQKPASKFLNKKDPFATKKFPWKRTILLVILLALIITFVVLVAKNPDGISGVFADTKLFFSKFHLNKGSTTPILSE